MRTYEDLKIMQQAPLAVKIQMTKQRIKEWIDEFGEDGVYVSFSGGKDSTVLLHIVRQDYPSVEAVFSDTGLEYPEIKEFVKTFDNVDIVRPEMIFDEVIRTYGYPMISKEVGHKFEAYNKNKTWAKPYIDGTAKQPNGEKSRYCVDRWKGIASMDFKISNKCCDVTKKKPLKNYQKRTGRNPIIATMACESQMRFHAWIMNGCNAFDSADKKSAPMSFWTEQDVLQYIIENNIPIAKPYGDVVDINGSLKTTKLKRTGCIYCGYGSHREKQSRWLLLKESHPKLYNYCINGGATTMTAYGNLIKRA